MHPTRTVNLIWANLAWIAPALIVAALIVAAQPAPAAPWIAPAADRAAAGLRSLVASRIEKMPPGMARAYVLGIQRELAAQGYRPGPADGVMGPGTAAAIRAYERAAGLAVSGRATSELLDHLKFARPKTARPSPASTLVRKVQRALKERGYDPGPIDGLAGPRSRAAVMAFQEETGFAPTGAIDAALLEELQAAN